MVQWNSLDNVKELEETSPRKGAEFSTSEHIIRSVSTAGIPGK